MRKQAKQLVVGRVYADMQYHSEPILLKFFGYTVNGSPLFTRVKGTGYNENDDGTIQFSSKLVWYELTPEEDAIYNKPYDPTFTLSDIQRVIERIEKEARFISDSDYDRHWVKFRDKAIEIMREELKIK